MKAMKEFDELSQLEREIVGCTPFINTKHAQPRTAEEICEQVNMGRREDFIFQKGNGEEKNLIDKAISFFWSNSKEPIKLPVEDIQAALAVLQTDGWMDHPPCSPKPDIPREDFWIRTQAALAKLLEGQKSAD